MTLLTVERLQKHFGGVAALDNCSLSLGEGTITGLIGPNGAGKTTLLNVITGLVKADAGKVSFNGDDITATPTHRIAALGLVRTFQIVR
jgi:ABC-type branched-subunit amino acid transport system ATPase component